MRHDVVERGGVSRRAAEESDGVLHDFPGFIAFKPFLDEGLQVLEGAEFSPLRKETPVEEVEDAPVFPVEEVAHGDPIGLLGLGKIAAELLCPTGFERLEESEVLLEVGRDVRDPLVGEEDPV